MGIQNLQLYGCVLEIMEWVNNRSFFKPLALIDGVETPRARAKRYKKITNLVYRLQSHDSVTKLVPFPSLSFSFPLFLTSITNYHYLTPIVNKILWLKSFQLKQWKQNFHINDQSKLNNTWAQSSYVHRSEWSSKKFCI